MSDVKILTTQRCPACEEGIVPHPAWKKFNEDETVQEQIKTFMRASQHAEAAEAENRWFLAYGHVGPLPPEEIACPVCNGTMRVQASITIAELLQLMNKDMQMVAQ